MRKQIMKHVAAPLRKSGRLEELLRVTRLRGSASSTPYQVVLPHATYSPWWGDVEFQKIWGQVRDSTFVDIYRLYELWSLAGQVSDLEGDILEVGVWRGGSGCTLAARSRKEGAELTVFLCDTFAGVAKAGPRDADYEGGELSDTSAELVGSLAARVGLDNVQILEGIFPDDTAHLVTSEKFRLVHIDVDVYQSALEVFEWSWPKLVSGGIVVFDDYGFYSQEGVTDLVNELAARDDLTFVHNVNGHGILVKR